MLRYEPVTVAEYARKRGSRRLGVETLQELLIFAFEGSVVDSGTVNDRNVRGSSRTKSLHSVGRAGDLGIRAGAGVRVGRSRLAIGDELAFRLIISAPITEVCEVIWNRNRWTPERGMRPYNGVNKHLDHLHWGMTVGAADPIYSREQLHRRYWSAMFPSL